MKTNRNILKSTFPLALLLFFLPIVGQAQHDSDQDNELEQLQNHLKNEHFSLGLLIQGLADFQPKRISGHNGFSTSKARFKVSGIFGNRFGYKLQATVLKSPSVIDANIFYKLNPNFSVRAGLFKAPFTREYLISSASILFVGRSTVVNQLSPKRQIGVQIDGFTPNKWFRYTVGVFNGNNFGNNSNDDGNFLYAGRIEANLINDDSPNSAKIGANISYEQKDASALTGNIQSTFEGEQTLAGAYFHISNQKLLLNTELIYSWMTSDIGREFNPYGYYITAGYAPTSNSQILLRWDAFTGDNLANDSEVCNCRL